MVLKVGKFIVDNFWSLERFILSTLSLAILIFLNKVLHIVLLYGSFRKQLIRRNLQIKIFKRPLPHGKYAVYIKFYPSFFRKSAYSVNILVLFSKFCQNFHYNFVLQTHSELRHDQKCFEQIASIKNTKLQWKF